MNPETQHKSRLAAAATIGFVAITLYWAFTYTGPYRYLAELQIKWFGSYVPKLTAIAIILGFLGIAALIKKVLQGAERSVPGLPAAPNPATSTTSASTASNVRVATPLIRYARYTAPIVILGFGVWLYSSATQAGGLQQLSAVDLVSGQLHSRIVYADVRGHLSEKYLVEDHYLYIPMYTDESTSSPVRLVVGIDESKVKTYMHRKEDGTFVVRGIADKGLQGDVKYAFEKNGMTVADPVWVVHTGRTPSEDRTMGLVLTGVSAAFAALLFGLDSYRKKKAAAPF